MAGAKKKHSLLGWFARGESMNARRAVVEEMFNDLYDDRRNIYVMNFFRGIFFGLGTAIGGTIVVALIIWTLSFFVDLPGIGQTAQDAQERLQNSQRR